MAHWVKSLLGKKKHFPAGLPGRRAYVVGDIHGRLDLLDQLLDRINDDAKGINPNSVFVVFLGDLIDRGPDSRGVIERLRNWPKEWMRPIFLMGNHEEVFLRILKGSARQISDWLEFGGVQCMASYGIQANRLAVLEEQAQLAEILRVVPQNHIDFLDTLVDTFEFGDYLMVHAGIRPGVPLAQQAAADLRWIRHEFLDSAALHPWFVIHGHTVTVEAEVRDNRIGIDTGAYASGRLTALVLDGSLLRTIVAKGDVGIWPKSLSD